MKLLTIFIFVFLTLSWLYILYFSAKEIIKGKYSSKSLFTILFLILIIDAIRTIIESMYFGSRLASQYGILPPEIFKILSNPSYLFIPKLINAIAALLIIYLIIKKWTPEKLKEYEKLEERYNLEKKDKEKFFELSEELDKRVKEKTKELEELNKDLEKRIKVEIEKNKIQEQKLYSQTKMAAMGEMIKNIAHQWRQPLSIISTLSSSARLRHEMQILEKDDLSKDLNQITHTVKHLSDTIQDFQDFFKPDKNIETFTFRDTINSSLKILEPTLKSNFITADININCNCLISGPYNEYTQVLLNVVNNARDALKNSDTDDKLIRISTKKEGEYCVLIVTDNAGGIKENILERIFEPYFTTKHQYQGTGLGLYMSKEIIEKHMNGAIEVENINLEHNGKTYNGAEFRIKTRSLKEKPETCEI